MMFSNDLYFTYSKALLGQKLPLAFLDLDAFDENIRHVRNIIEGTGRTIRVGTKSIRSEPLTKRIFELGGPDFKGLLTFTAEETAWLANKGYDDFIIAYPTMQSSDLDLIIEMIKAGKTVRPMVDCAEHFYFISSAAQAAKVEIETCLEIDMAYRPFNSKNNHLGVRRSPLRVPDEALKLIRKVEKIPSVKVKAVMGYEGHIAGTGDAVPGRLLKNKFLRFLKKRSVIELTNRRRAVVQALLNEGIELEVVNGGGSGSLISTLKDSSVTEVTVGSGFYCPALFHYFAEIKYHPAAFFATQVVRFPAPAIITCLGGGYPASGPAGPDKLPLPVMPVGLKYLPLEGAGEVQTPLMLPDDCPDLKLGDPIIFQHAKGGELSERFNEIILLQDSKVIGKTLTYRGEGKAFL